MVIADTATAGIATAIEATVLVDMVITTTATVTAAAPTEAIEGTSILSLTITIHRPIMDIRYTATVVITEPEHQTNDWDRPRVG